VLLVSGLTAALALLVADGAHAQSPGPAKVVKLRVDTVALYDQPNGKKVREYPRGQFGDPWPVVGRSDKGFLQVQVDGARYWVRGYAVETDTPFRIGADCDAVVASRQPKAGVTRGIGEECKK